jgi:hypothetical protein
MPDRPIRVQHLLRRAQTAQRRAQNRGAAKVVASLVERMTKLLDEFEPATTSDTDAFLSLWFAAIKVGFAAALLVACGGSPSHASLYDCAVVQLRSGGSCEEPLPNCSGSGAGVPWTFQLQVSGNTVVWVGCPGFSCTGTWSNGAFNCTLPVGATQVGGQPCPAEPWTLLPEDPNPARALQPGEVLYAGIPVNNSFNAHCRVH